MRSTPWNCTFQRSNWGSFSRSIQWWGQISCAAVQISWQKGKIAVNWDLHHGIAHVKGQIGVVSQGQSSGEVKLAVKIILKSVENQFIVIIFQKFILIIFQLTQIIKKWQIWLIYGNLGQLEKNNNELLQEIYRDKL